ncbi:MAG: 2-oxoglutarate dehydrogenase E1 component [Legionella sp.]|nr:2-oxoglutarate dehydrogenase E1 component [Legionella sp.]
MSSSDLQQQWASAYLSGGSMAYVDSLYEDYLLDPNSLPADWKAVFDAFPKVKGAAKEVPHKEIRNYFLQQVRQPSSSKVTQHVDSKQYQVANLINAFRTYGHLAAKLDPLGLAHANPVPNLGLAYHELSKEDKDSIFYVGTDFNSTKISLGELDKALHETYCGSIGIEYMHLFSTEETKWWQYKMESVRARPSFDAETKLNLLKDLIAADGLERYLGTRYVGQKRFSLEGGDALIPLMKNILNKAGKEDVKEVVIGMAHRGRLNVLVNVLGKEPGELFQEFEGKIQVDRTGDVKYHQGFSSYIKTNSSNILHVVLAFNPSHLEIISPVVEGSVRARLRRRNDLAEKNSVIPVVIHGDAAFAGQGVVMETFNFSQAPGYCTGGTIHIVVNNQIGFTTNPADARSTPYCTDVAKMVEAPVLHVNGDDPEAVIFATQLAFDFRMKFKRDVVIDLVCYRRQGHNEADEPAVTQPCMYKQIKNMRPLREIYAEQLIKEDILTSDEAIKLVDAYRDRLDKGETVVELFPDEFNGKYSANWAPYLQGKWTDKADTTISKESLYVLTKQLQTIPDTFHLHPVVIRLLADRQKMTEGEIPMNWGYAENLAFASLLQEGYGVRLSGQDSGRGTFGHRHAVLHDIETGEFYTPLKNISKKINRPFDVIDSVLSEEAVLAFEYGYSSSEPDFLDIWEAQFGDFANGAQVVIDQFISSGEQKWGRLCGLVMMLPHGYEGQGPEHSSARLERFMQLCAQHNIQVCTPTTPAQIFHLLRRQMLRDFRKPLIIMTPKSLLRHKLAVSSLDDLIKGKFYNIIPEIDAINAQKITKVVLCCGKVYYDLLQMRRDKALKHVAIIRIEQLYPFPIEELQAELGKYPQANTVVWCQEEPQNQGVWFSSQHNMIECLRPKQDLIYVGREVAAAPAVGSPVLHAQQQQALVEKALSPK